MSQTAITQSSELVNVPSTGLLRPILSIVAGSALVAVCAHVSFPLLFTPVPVTLQTFAVLFIGLLLGPNAAFASLSLYLLEGAAGLPVFSPHGLGGLLQLAGPTGGYLLSYPFAAALAGFLYRQRPRSFMWGVLSAGSASALILLTGATWLAFAIHMSGWMLVTQSILPFLPGDVLKVLAAAGAASLISKRL